MGSPRSRTAVVIPEGFGAALWEVIIWEAGWEAGKIDWLI